MAVASLVGIAAALGGGEFDELQARVLGTAAAGLVAGGAALAGLFIVERDVRQPLGWIVVGVAVVTFAALALAIWWESGWDRHGERLGRVVLSAVALLLAAVVVGTLRRALGLELRPVHLAFWAVAGLVGVTAVFAVAAIWVPSVDDVSGQTENVDLAERSLVALFVAIVGSFLVLPLLERALAGLLQSRQRIDRGPA